MASLTAGPHSCRIFRPDFPVLPARQVPAGQLRNDRCRPLPLRQPRAGPGYDIVTTQAYVRNETGTALNMARQKRCQALNMAAFETWSTRIGAPWPAQLAALPMRDDHKALLQQHWARLAADFRLP